MENSTPPNPVGDSTRFFDTDVVVSWLVDEVDPATGYPLWKAPRALMKQIEAGHASGRTSLFTLLELRYLLRRRKVLAPSNIESLITQLEQLLRIVIPDELTLLRANSLQAKHGLGPIDAVQLATAMFEDPCTFVSRDAALLKVAGLFIAAQTPEELLRTPLARG